MWYKSRANVKREVNDVHEPDKMKDCLYKVHHHDIMRMHPFFVMSVLFPFFLVLYISSANWQFFIIKMSVKNVDGFLTLGVHSLQTSLPIMTKLEKITHTQRAWFEQGLELIRDVCDHRAETLALRARRRIIGAKRQTWHF